MWPFRRKQYEPVQVIDYRTFRWTYEGDYQCDTCYTKVHVTDRMKIRTLNTQEAYGDYVKCPSCNSAIWVERKKTETTPQEGV